MDLSNNARADRGQVALEAYAKEHGDYNGDEALIDDFSGIATDCIADILHAVKRETGKQEQAESVHQAAIMHFEEEV